MSLKHISVRIPESMHTYVKVKAAAESKSVQQIFTNIIADYQSRDTQYQVQLNKSVTDSINALASITHEEVHHGV